MKAGYLLLVLLISTLLIPASGCQSGDSNEYNAVELVPAECNFIAGIQINKIISDQDIKDTYDKMEKDADKPQTFDEALDELFQESGIDINDFSHALIFGDIRDRDMEQADYFGFIAEGNFDEGEFIENVEKNSGEQLSAGDYKGRTIYTGEDGEFSITFLNDKMLLGGSTQAVKDSIDVSQGESQAVEGQLLNTYHRYGDGLVALAMEVPDETRDSFTDESMISEIPIPTDVFSSMDVVGFSVDKEKETLSCRIEFHFLEADSVEDAHDTISGMITMFKGMMEEPELKEFMGNIEVSAADSWLTISFGIDLTQIEEMAETFGDTFRE